jgi:hypothetical protein
MKNGMTIFLHSWRQVVGNLGMAVRASGGVWLLLFGAGVVLTLAAILSGSQFLAALFMITFVVMAVWGVSLVAVVWHRYILLEEPPAGFVPMRDGMNIWPYFWSGIGITFIGSLVLMLLYFLATLFVEPSWIQQAFFAQPVSMQPAHILMRWAVGMLVTVIYLRLALALPAIALDKKLSFAASWQSTKPYFGAIVNVSFILSLFNAVVMLVYGAALDAVAGSAGVRMVVVVLGLGFQWFYFMLNISILSTLYGHIIEKREVY